MTYNSRFVYPLVFVVRTLPYTVSSSPASLLLLFCKENQQFNNNRTGLRINWQFLVFWLLYFAAGVTVTGSSLTIPRREKHALYFQKQSQRWLFTRTSFSRVVKNFRNRLWMNLWPKHVRPSGPLTIGEELMSFEIAETVTVKCYSGK